MQTLSWTFKTVNYFLIKILFSLKNMLFIFYHKIKSIILYLIKLSFQQKKNINMQSIYEYKSTSINKWNKNRKLPIIKSAKTAKF